MHKVQEIRNRWSRKSEDKVTLGMVSGSIWRKEELSEGELNHHVHVVGASGFGKTVLLSHIIQQRIEQGKGLLFIDLKGDRETFIKFSQVASKADRIGDLESFSLTDQDLSIPYNLIEEGTATQLRDRIIMALNWSEEFYKNQTSSFLLKLLIVLCWLRDHQQRMFHLGTVLDCASSQEAFMKHAVLVPLGETKIKLLTIELAAFLKDRESFQSLQGLRTQLESIVLSDFGGLVCKFKGINLFEAIRDSKIIFLFLDSRRYGETAKSMGRFILQDLKSVSARIDAEVPKEQRKPFSVIIDEFADLASEDFIAFLDRARSAKISIVVSHQEICDLQRVSPEFAGRLMGNASTLYAFLQKRPESAELISGMAGTRKAWKETVQSDRLFGIDIPTGGKSLREVEEFNVHPNLIKSLQVGKCVCIKKYPKSRAYLVRVAPGDKG